MIRTFALAALLLLLSAAAGVADGPECTCRDHGGCYHWLGAPVVPVNEPCPCPRCDAERGSCPRILPKGWDPTCANNSKMECFLRRHGASWKLVCSERLAGTCDCDNPHPERCPNCGKNGNPWGEEEFPQLRRHLEIERRILGKRAKFIVIRSPHFYLVTNIPSLKIRTQEKSPRTMKMHEIAHLFIQRAEVAYRDFTRYFGDEIFQQRPMAIYLMDREDTKQEIAQAYFGLPEPELFYGGDIQTIGGGLAWNGCAISKGKYREDHHLHHQMRHLLGHLLLSCYLTAEVDSDHLPRWAYAGAGHWLSRLPAHFREDANFCSGEGTEVRHDGEKWEEMLISKAMSGKLASVQSIFDVNSLGGLDLYMHLRTWSWFDRFLEEDRAQFVAFIRELRGGADHRVALKKAFGITPEEWDRRWRERILGKRDGVGPTPEELDTADPGAPGAAERESIRGETDPKTLAAKIRALIAVNDPRTAATLVPLLDRPEDGIRESAVVVLSATTSPEVREYLRTTALSGRTGLSRAYVARIIANIGDPEAGPALVERLGDPHWLVRAHAARGIASAGYEPGIVRVRNIIDDSAQKVRVAALLALARFGAKAGEHWDPVADNLGSALWPVRSAAAECLGELGRMEAVDALVERMEIESGRVREDIYQALKKITRDDLGRKPEHWRSWWDRERKKYEGKLPPRRSAPREEPKGEPGYAKEPTYYGIKVHSHDVGYVVDTSQSMAYEIELDEAWLKRQGREYSPVAPKFLLVRREVEASLRALDRRTRFNVWFFRSVASRMGSKFLRATPENIEKALRRIETEMPRFNTEGRGKMYRTNYIDVFRMIYGVKAGAPPSPKFGSTPDTIFFMTDGKPTVGDIVHPEVLLAWVRELNRFNRVRVNVITFGLTASDPEFTRRLAEENGGVFVPVPAMKK